MQQRKDRALERTLGALGYLVLVVAVVAACAARPAETAAVLHEALEKAAPGLLGCAALLTALR